MSPTAWPGSAGAPSPRAGEPGETVTMEAEKAQTGLLFSCRNVGSVGSYWQERWGVLPLLLPAARIFREWPQPTAEDGVQPEQGRWEPCVIHPPASP